MEWKLECNSSMQACMLLSLSASSFHSAKLNELTYLSFTQKIALPSCEKNLDVQYASRALKNVCVTNLKRLEIQQDK
jgi:hypothetical protein